MLDMNKVQQMTDVIHGSIPYSGIEQAIISTPIYNRLHRVLQSSLVFFTYPSNKVKRFEHSVGTMHIAGNIFFNSLCNADSKVFTNFIEDISTELVNWRNNINFNEDSFINKDLRVKYKDKDILEAPVPESEFYNRYYPRNLNENQIFPYYVAFQSVRLAALLHDAGHLPYSHILEHAMKKMYITVKSSDNRNDAENYFLEVMKRFAEGNDEIHEEIGKLLVIIIKNCITENLNKTNNAEMYFFLAVFYMANKIISSTNTDNTIFSDLHSITASSLDADRLDYCSRDSFCSGTNKCIYPYERLLFTYKLQYIKSDLDDRPKRYYFCPSTKTVSAIEELLRRRLRIFSDINFHHRVHKHELLLEEVISEIGLQELKNMTNYNNLTDAIPLKVSSIWKLVSKLDDKSEWLEYQIIQLDDSWIDTLLKNNFFEKYKSDYLSMYKNGDNILWNRFDELISTTKHYHSFFKRSSDYRKFDKALFTKLIENIDPKLLKMIFMIENPDKIISYEDFSGNNKSLFFNYCVEHLFKLDKKKLLFFEDFEDKLNEYIKKENTNIIDCLLRPCLFSFGYKSSEPIYLWDVSNQKDAIRIEQLSSQYDAFQRERALSPIFHLYYLPNYDKNHNEIFQIDKNGLLDILVNIAFTLISSELSCKKVLTV